MDNSPTSLFESYEQDFKQIINSIRDKTEGEGANERGGAQSLFLPQFTTQFYSLQSRGKRLCDV